MGGGDIPAPPMPRSANERDVGGRMFLSGLVGGFNSQTGGVGSKPGATAGGGDPLTLAKFAETLRHNRTLEANTNTDNARLAKSQADLEGRTAQSEADRKQFHADMLTEQARDDARANKMLGIALAGLGLRKNADARSAERAARQAKAEAAYSKLSPGDKAVVDGEKAKASAQFKNDGDAQAYFDHQDAIEGYVLSRGPQGAVTPGPTHENPTGPTGVASGHSSLAPAGQDDYWVATAKAAKTKANAVSHLNANSKLNPAQRLAGMAAIQQVYGP
jgi:hypothetical protein